MAARVSTLVADSPIFTTILGRWAEIALPDCWLSGSAIAQTAWNAKFGLPTEYGLADIDLVYFDATDLSDIGEARQAARIRGLFADIPLWIDAKNEARVHLWYEAKFGYPIEPYRSSEHAISTFPTTAGSVAIRPDVTGLSIFAPFGLDDLLSCTVRPNKAQITQDIYEAKVSRWRSCWPALTIIEWNEAQMDPGLILETKMKTGVMMIDHALAEDIRTIASLKGEFKLRSGQISSHYFDKYRFESDPALLRRIAAQMIPLLPSDTEILAGLELGGVPIATAISLASSLPVAFIRKRAKEYGTCQAVEGRDVEGKRIVLIEDVITTGGAVADDVKLVEAAKGQVIGVVCAIWRGDGDPGIVGLPSLPVSAALTAADLIG